MKRYWLFSAAILVLLLTGVRAGNRNVYRLPEDRGTAGALAALEKLPVYARVLHTTAHPDDESTGTLTWLSRKFHAQTALFSLTRGEGGQNILGNEKYEALGLVRTGELLEACNYYGVELFFSSVTDFGFSKTAEETLSKWGLEATLEEMVRFIRWWRPTIIISRFQGDSGDGHGHHQAAGILTREAFRAAGNPLRFPEQLKRGLLPWQPQKLFVSSRPWAASSSDKEKAEIARVPVGDYDPVLGRSYREIGSEGYSKHRTQGNGTTYSLPGHSYDNYRLADSAVESIQKDGTLFDSIDTSLMAIWELAGNEKQSVPFLKEDLTAIQQSAAEALSSFQVTAPERSAVPAARGARILSQSMLRVRTSSLSKPTKEIILGALDDKLKDFQKAVNATLGIYLVSRADDSTAVPGEQASINLSFYNQGPEKIGIARVFLKAPPDKGGFDLPAVCLEGISVSGGGSASCKLLFQISPKASFTEPFWHLENSTDVRYKVLPTENVFSPFGQPEVEADVRYTYQESEFPVSAAVAAQTGDPLVGSDFVDFQIVPELSVTMNPGIVISPTGPSVNGHEFQVSVLNNSRRGARGNLKILAPSGWQVEPKELQFNLSRKGESFTAKYLLRTPQGTKPGNYLIEAVAVEGNQEFRRGYQTISYPENWTRYLYRPAQSKVEIFNLEVAPDLTIGYIPGAGDDIPTALNQLGVKLQLISAADLAFGDLKRFSAIVTGIRAYNVNEDLRANNQRLLDYVAQGGTLIVQYVRPMGRSAGGAESPFQLGPYPMSVSDSERITVEESPIKILDPSHPVFNRPNKITADDFQSWVQERGLYFMSSWDERYIPLLSGNDPGESPKNGGMLYARHGKGHFIYTGYAWFRQLPAGVPGAFRIFANMISLGKP